MLLLLFHRSFNTMSGLRVVEVSDVGVGGVGVDDSVCHCLVVVIVVGVTSVVVVV